VKFLFLLHDKDFILVASLGFPVKVLLEGASYS